MSTIVGLDVGGAHLKAALTKQDQVSNVVQHACPLWQGLEHLSRALDAASPLTDQADRIAVTMTGELSDLFPDRQTGVETLIDVLSDRFGSKLVIWCGVKGFTNAATARAQPGDVGSANFIASAQFIASQRTDALFIDFGSTTTDVIAITDGTPQLHGLIDSDRQASGELIYTGLTRTAVMAVVNQVPLAGRWHSLAREYLATMADVRRLLGTLPADVDQHATADGRGKSIEESRIRFARLFGHDVGDRSVDDWRQAAAYVADIQLRSLHDGAALVLSRHALNSRAPVIAAGIGADVVGDLASRLGRPCQHFGGLSNCRNGDVERAATESAPAVAVARLLAALGRG